MRFNVYKLTDDSTVVGVGGFSLAGVTRVTCTLYPSEVVVDSDAQAGLITWTDTEITFNLNDLDVNGVQQAKVRVIDPNHPNGQTLSHPEIPGGLEFLFLD